eukprot:Gb_23283 [translate_table: standard]
MMACIEGEEVLVPPPKEQILDKQKPLEEENIL